MNPFKAIGRVVTAPVRAVRNTVRLLKIRAEAEDVLELADEAEADPRLYRDPSWWSRLLTQAGELLAVLPLPKEIRDMQFLKNALVNWKSTLGGLAAGMAAASIVAHDLSKISDPMVLGLLGAAWAGLTGKDANVTGGTKPATAEASLRTN